MSPAPAVLRRAASREETGSMALYMVIAVLGLLLSAMLVPMVITQDRTTRLDTTRVHALGAAQAGIDIAVGRIRAAEDGGVGTTSTLPCGPMSGPVSQAGPAAYDVTIRYYLLDPVTNQSARVMRCVGGYGTYEPESGTSTPSYARITSKGTDGPAVNGSSAGRTLVTTYVFKTQNANIPGGVVRIYPAAGSANDLCMDAGSAAPTAGTAVALRTCSISNPPAAQQVFAYRTDLTLQLLSSVTTGSPNGMCLDTSAPPTAGSGVALRGCSPLNHPAYTQQWSFNDNGAYQAANADGSLTSPGLCMNVSGQSAGTQVALARCENNTKSPAQAWIPAPSVGAGMAASFTNSWGGTQWVNYAEFGRCLDIHKQLVSSPFQIDYPCKQSPLRQVAWNQMLTMPDPGTGPTATGQVSTTKDSTRYCLTSPGTDGGYPVLQVCSSTDPGQTWTRYGASSTLTYSRKYTVVDSTGLCLGLTQVAGEPWSRVVVERCTGALEQKWNASPNLVKPALKDTREE